MSFFQNLKNQVRIFFSPLSDYKKSGPGLMFLKDFQDFWSDFRMGSVVKSNGNFPAGNRIVMIERVKMIIQLNPETSCSCKNEPYPEESCCRIHQRPDLPVLKKRTYRQQQQEN